MTRQITLWNPAKKREQQKEQLVCVKCIRLLRKEIIIYLSGNYSLKVCYFILRFYFLPHYKLCIHTLVYHVLPAVVWKWQLLRRWCKQHQCWVRNKYSRQFSCSCCQIKSKWKSFANYYRRQCYCRWVAFNQFQMIYPVGLSFLWILNNNLPSWTGQVIVLFCMDVR